jgi:hypothetical protein
MASIDKAEDFLQQCQSHDQGTETEPTRPYIYAPLLSEYPARVICPNCHAQVLTRCTYFSGFLTWVFATGLFLFG